MGAFFMKLLSMVLGGLLARVLVGAGLTIVTYAGLTVALETLLEEMVSHFAELPAAVVNICLLFGVGDAMSIVGSAMMTVMAFKSMGLSVAFTNQAAPGSP